MSFFDEEDFDVEGYLNDEHDGHYESSDESDTLSGSELSSESARTTPDSNTSRSNQSFWWDDVGIMDHLIHHSPHLFKPLSQQRITKASAPTQLVHCAYTIFPLAIASLDTLDSEKGTQLNLDELLMLKSKAAQLPLDDVSWLASQFINVGLFEDAKDLVKDLDSLKIAALSHVSRSAINNVLGFMLAEEQRYAEAVKFFRLVLNDLIDPQRKPQLDTSFVDDVDGDGADVDTTVADPKHLMMVMQTAINGSICLMQIGKFPEVDAFMQWMHTPRWSSELSAKALRNQPCMW
eukprot:m.143797 g.143797  ORF g.143797 m.143797 type:complete len:292 (-) comp30335_c0_seq2:749-1624(-)